MSTSCKSFILIYVIFSKKCYFERDWLAQTCHQIFIFLECDEFQQLFARRESAEPAVSHCWLSQGWLMAYCTVNRWSTSAHMSPSIIPRAWRLRAWYASLSLSNRAPLIDSFRSCILHKEHLNIKYYYWILIALTVCCRGRGSVPGAWNRCSIRRTKDRCSRCTSARALKPPAPDRYACRLVEWTFASWLRFYLLTNYFAVWNALI